MRPLRILVADDHEIVRRGICFLLKDREGWEICAEASDGRDAVEKASLSRPDVSVIDVCMPKLNGLEATRQILLHDPSHRVLILTAHTSDQLIDEVLRAGARGYLFKSDAGNDLIEAVSALAMGKTYFNSRIDQFLLNGYLRGRESTAPPFVAHQLTAREREIVQLVVEGQSTKEIAVTLGISVKTAETHRSNIMRKLRVHSVSELVLSVVRDEIVKIGPQGIVLRPDPAALRS